MNPFNIIKYQLYLLQLENYELKRYFRLLWQKGFWPKGKMRKQLVWTPKAKVILAVAILIDLVFVFANSRADEIRPYVAVGLFLFFPFIFYTIAVWILYPIDAFLKARIVKQAKQKITKFPNLKIIGVAGSYGKTTMKEVLQAVTSVKFKVKSTPESVNTPVGIGRWILKEVDSSVDIIIVEMGEHYRNDIKDIIDIVKPDISVITGINEAHLERFGTLHNTIATIFEAAEFAKAGALLILNADDKLVVENYKKFCGNYPTKFYSSNNHPLSKNRVSDVEVRQDAGGQEFTIDDEKYTTRLLAEYVIADAEAGLIVGQHLGESITEIKIGISQVKPISHRLEPIINPNGIIIIDDSYNGNPEGVAQAIGLLKKFKGKRKIYLTPGLVEMGEAAADVHREIGRQLVGVADIVILVRNSVTGYIEEGIKQQATGNSVPQIIWFNTAPEAHAGLKTILKPGDVVLFQNDWGDNYV